MPVIELLLLVICIFLLVVAVFVGGVILLTDPYPILPKFEQEKFYLNPVTDEQESFPSLSEPPSLSLSVVVPAYNEEQRLPDMLAECIDILEVRRQSQGQFDYEVIIVDDGSSDATSAVGHKWAAKHGSNRIRVLTLVKNRGKGGAVRLGVLRARGKRVLFADADGATKFADLAKLEAKMDELEGVKKQHNENLGIVCGSRAHLEQESIAQRSLFRTFLMFGFHWCVRVFGAKSVKDTQCGFKLLTRDAARLCFNSLHIERWAFDVELLKIAEMEGIPIAEVAVRWIEIDGSKMNPMAAAVQMFKDLFLLWLRYRIGAWRIKPRRD